MARTRWVAALAAFASLLLTGGVVSTGHAATAVDWPQYHGHPSHRGLNPVERTVGPTNVSSLSLSWIGNGATFGEDLVFRSSPTVVDGFVYFGTDGGQLLAFRDDCQGSECLPAWSVDLTQGIYNTPAVSDGVLFVGTASPLGRLFAFDVRACATGACLPLWSAKVAVGDSSPTVSNGVVYVGSQFGGVYAFSASGCGRSVCDPLWVGNTAGFVDNSPAVSGGMVYVGGSDKTFYAFDAAGCGASTCDPLWTAPVTAPIYSSSPAVANGVVFIRCGAVPVAIT
jgi:outer membrane protein assembly factor BamB